METPVGPFAMINCEPRQARKGATVAVTSCAEVWLAGVAASANTSTACCPYLSALAMIFCLSGMYKYSTL